MVLALSVFALVALPAIAAGGASTAPLATGVEDGGPGSTLSDLLGDFWRWWTSGATRSVRLADGFDKDDPPDAEDPLGQGLDPDGTGKPPDEPTPSDPPGDGGPETPP